METTINFDDVVEVRVLDHPATRLAKYAAGDIVKLHQKQALSWVAEKKGELVKLPLEDSGKKEIKKI